MQSSPTCNFDGWIRKVRRWVVIRPSLGLHVCNFFIITRHCHQMPSISSACYIDKAVNDQDDVWTPIYSKWHVQQNSLYTNCATLQCLLSSNQACHWHSCQLWGWNYQALCVTSKKKTKLSRNETVKVGQQTYPSIMSKAVVYCHWLVINQAVK